MDFLPIEIRPVPSKREINSAIATLIDNPAPAIEKYVWVKALEQFVKAAVDALKKQAITSYLEMKEGSICEEVLGAEVKITKERISKTIEKYTYSEVCSNIQKDIDAKEFELRLLREKLKLEQLSEINLGVAKKDIWEENGVEELSIRITIPK